MGNNASNQYEQINNKTDFTFTYQLLKKVNEPHYGEVKVVRDIKTGEQIFLKEVVLTTKDTYQAELDFYNKRISVSHPNVVRIYGCNGTDQQNFCSSYFKISVFIEMLPKTLAHELESRFETGVPFSENDILLIAENLIAGLSYFEAQDVFHGDIRPENIFVSSNAYKLSDPNLYPQKSANALSHVLLGNAKTLLSPELLAQVPQHDFAIKCNKFKADVFSLGATLLSLASLTDAKELYDYENGGFDLDGLQERLELVRKTYSKFTFELIRDMLKIHEEQRPDFIALSNRLLPYQEDIRQKYELPFFGIRAPYEEKREEDHMDISRYTYEEKSNPVLMDFINSQMSQSSVKRKPQRDSNGSSSRAEDITPGHSHGHNAFGRERDSAQESYRKSGNLMAEFEKTEVNQSPYRQEVSAGYMQSHLAEQLYREDPTRNPFQRNVQAAPPQQFEQNRRTQPYPLLNIQQHQQHQEHPSHQTGKVDTSRSSQVRNEAPVEVFERQYHEPQYEQQVRYEAPKRSYAQEPQTHRQLELQQQQQQQYQQQQQQQQQQQAYFQPQIQYQPTQTPVHIEPKVPLYLSESHIQAQIQRQENTNEPQGESSDLDDLEAKIKAALERSEATYKRASRPAYQGSPDKHQSAKKSAPPAETANYQLSYSAYPTQRVSGFDIPEVPANIVTSSSVYVKPTELEDATNLQYMKPTNLYSQSFAKAHDLNNSPPNQSEMQTNVQSNENTLYDFNPTFLSQSGVSNGNYYNTTTPVGYTSQYNQSTSYPATATLQYQQRLPSGESWERAGMQYDNKGVDKNFYSFATPLGHDTLQRHEHNALINGDHKNLIQHVIQD